VVCHVIEVRENLGLVVPVTGLVVEVHDHLLRLKVVARGT
jgi:hypothetical protein